jgi:hypothetical protein
LFLYVFLSLFVGCRLFVFGYYSSFLFWVTATSSVALSGFGLNFLFHSGLTKTHLVHQKWIRKEKTKPQFCLHFILKHKFLGLRWIWFHENLNPALTRRSR